MSAHAWRRPVEDRSNVQIDGFDAANSPFHLGETLVGPDSGAVVEGRGREVGADHVDAVEASLGVDGILLASEREVGVGDGEREVLGHLVLADDGTGLKRNLGGASQRLLDAANPVLDFDKVTLGCGEQILALASARDGELGVSADDQALAGIVIGSDAGQITLIEQRELKDPRNDQGTDLRGAQRGDPVESSWLDIPYSQKIQTIAKPGLSCGRVASGAVLRYPP